MSTLTETLTFALANGASNVTFARDEHHVRCSIDGKYHGRGATELDALNDAIALARTPRRYQIAEWAEVGTDTVTVPLVSAPGSRALEPGTAVVLRGHTFVIRSVDVAANTVTFAAALRSVASVLPGDWMEVMG